MTDETYERLTAKNMVNLAAPHTWVASILPVLLGTELSIAEYHTFYPVLFILMLAASVLLQSSVNTLNDYHDFIKGTDRIENSDDPGDAVLVYNNIDPKHVRTLGFAFMAAAAICGIYPVLCGGITTLIIGIIGCAVIVLYSTGPRPLSSFPIGEPLSGVVMGGFITCGVYSVNSFYPAHPPQLNSAYYGFWLSDFGPVSDISRILLLSVPLIISIALIMMTNNICDIERDLETGRITLPVRLGRKKARIAYRIISVLWILSIIALVAVFFKKGIMVCLIALVISVPAIKKLLTAPLTPDQRGPGMGAIVKSNYYLGATYIAAIAADIIFIA
ncbi:MAG: prenyltransferase [Clostridiales Family XIII bacterium]|jgi:1,4-dihydroxy-2-naphthoate octaprenyltransferase|nr:prenyltransferase [Clostridiales Family XIII bacterium]